MDNKRIFLSLSAMGHIMKAAGSPRVADSAKSELAKVLQEKGEEISRRALKYAEHAGRRTIRAEDIELAVKESV